MSSEELQTPIACPGDWPLVQLKAVSIKIGSGATPTGGQSAYQKRRTNFALVRSQNVFDRSFSEDGLAFISDEQAAALKGVKLQRHDLLINITGDGITFGRACLVPDSVFPACVNQHVAIIRLDQTKADPGFVLSYLTHPSVKQYIEAMNAGGSRRAITKAHIESFVIPLPSLSTQKSIARILSAHDDRITLLRETNATLEGITQALFKSWFVDFDPVRAKTEGREPEGMDEATAGLFPDSFEESELGLVPKGWAICSLDQHVSAERGLSYKGAGLAERGQGVPMHNLNSVLEGGGYKYPGIKFYNGVFKDKHLVNSGEIIVANTEQGHEHRLIGFPAIVPRAYSGTAIYSHHIYRVRLLDGSPLSMSFLYRTLMTPAVREQIIGCANGSTVNMLKVVGLQTPKFVCPSFQVCKAYELIASPIQDAIEANVERVENLTTLRDTLLPRLVSGQLRLPTSEPLCEFAA